MKLKMVHRSPAEAPEPELPDGYRLRTLEETDRDELVRLYRLGELGIETVEELTRKLEGHESFRPEHVFVVEGPSGLAATAAAFVDREDPELGFLHMVSVDPVHRGQGLGRALTCAALRLHAEMGLRHQWLLTDPWRTPAIRLYRSLGYEPLAENPGEEERWAEISEDLQEPYER